MKRIILLMLAVLLLPVHVRAEREVRIYNSKDAFTLEHNAGPVWFWRALNVSTGDMTSLALTVPANTSGGDRFVLRNPWDSTQANLEGADVAAAVGMELMWPDRYGSSAGHMYAAVKTFVAPESGDAVITNEIFKNADSGYSRAKITLNGEQIWPTEKEWETSLYKGEFAGFSANGLALEITEGDVIDFILYNNYSVSGNKYNARALWSPIVTVTPLADYHWSAENGGITLQGVFHENGRRLVLEFTAVNNSARDIDNIVPILTMSGLVRDEQTNMLKCEEFISVAMGESRPLPMGDTANFEAEMDLSCYDIEGQDFVFTLYLWGGMDLQTPLFEKKCWYYIEL